MRKTVRIAAALAVLGGTLAWASGIWLAQIEGTCVDEAGKPLGNAELKFLDKNKGHRFSARTDAHGKFFFGGAQPGAYQVAVLRGGKTLMEFPAIAIGWSSRPLQVSLDLSKHAIAVKRESRQAETFAGETAADDPAPVVIGEDPQTLAVRDAIERARTRGDSGDWEAAIAILKASAESSGSGYDVVWSQLAHAYCHAGRLEGCVAAYGKAIDRNGAGAYYNNRAQALIQLKSWEDARRDLTAAEKANPERRNLYQQNLGVMLMQKVQQGESEDEAADFQAAAGAFSVVLAEEPDKAELYYLRAYCQMRLLGLAEEPPKAAEIESGLRRYLELAPAGPHAQEVRGILASIAELKD